MTLQMEVIPCGQMGNNVCVLFDTEDRLAAVFDPSYQPDCVLDFITRNELTVQTIFLTHGHFDHFAGVSFLDANLPNRPTLIMHHDDLELLRDGGGSKNFHIPVIPPDDPDLFVEDGQVLKFGKHDIEVRLAPGHTPGSVIYVIPEVNSAVCGDVIFNRGIGRTDLTGGDYETLLESIRAKVFTLPPEMVLIPGHGEVTMVGDEKRHNPFLN